MKPTIEQIYKKRKSLMERDTTAESDFADLCEWYHQECLKSQYDDIEWPDDAVGIVCFFTDLTKDVYLFDNEYKDYIERPKKKMEFKVGDKVFCGNTDTIYTVSKVNEKSCHLRFYAEVTNNQLKHATLELMGKPWEEIPNE